MGRVLPVDYLVIGAGATGMAFADALVEHGDARVAIIDRRHDAGGHWLDAYAFVRLHQASQFYGVASTLLGGGRLQTSGPEVGLQERATVSEIVAYYERTATRLQGSGRVEIFPSCEYLRERQFVSRLSGARFEVPERCRIVDAHYLSPAIPANTAPSFAAGDGARVVPVNALASLDEAASQYVIVGSGKTATDAIVWLIGRGVDSNAICWVRPRDPWMLNRALVQPDPAVFLGMAATTMQAAAASASLDDLFLRLEDAGIMLRVDRSVTPTMARTPTLSSWELDVLRTVENVVRLGHLRSVEPGKLIFDGDVVGVASDAVVVHCAADGLRVKPAVPIWAPEAMILQPVRTGFPCFGAALAGYIEATRGNDDVAKNRLCPSSSFSSTLAEWARMQVEGTRAAQSFNSATDVRDWAGRVPLNPARIPPGHAPSRALDDALERLQKYTTPGVSRLAELASAR